MKLKPCPFGFCRSENVTIMHQDISTSVICLDCGAYGPDVPRLGDGWDDDEAARLWNEREEGKI